MTGSVYITGAGYEIYYKYENINFGTRDFRLCKNYNTQQVGVVIFTRENLV